MSESAAKSSQALASKGEKDTSEKRGRGRPRKKPQVCGVPWEEGGGGNTPTRHPQAMGEWETPPACSPAASPGQGMGVPTAQPPLPPEGLTSANPSWGALQSPLSPAAPQIASSPREGLRASPCSS